MRTALRRTALGMGAALCVWFPAVAIASKDHAERICGVTGSWYRTGLASIAVGAFLIACGAAWPSQSDPSTRVIVTRAVVGLAIGLVVALIAVAVAVAIGFARCWNF